MATPTTATAGNVRSLLPALKPLDMIQELWVAWKLRASEYKLYETATGLAGKPKEVQAAMFLVLIGKDSWRISIPHV